MSIIHIADDIKKEFEIHPDGTTSVSNRGAARLLGVDSRGLDRNCRADQMSRSYAEYLDLIGFKGGDRQSERITDIELSIFAKYYAYKVEEKDRSKQAELVDLVFSAIGARTWIKTELGYNQPVQPKALSTKDLTLDQLMVQGGFWFVPTEEQLKYESGREHLHLTPEKYAEIKASIDPIFDSLQQDAIDPMLVEVSTDAFAHIFGLYAISNDFGAGTNVKIASLDVNLKVDFDWYRQRAASSACIKAAQQFQAQLDRTQLAPGANNLQLAQID